MDASYSDLLINAQVDRWMFWKVSQCSVLFTDAVILFLFVVVVVVWSVREGFGSSSYCQWIDARLILVLVFVCLFFQLSIFLFIREFIYLGIYFCLSERDTTCLAFSFIHF